MDRQALIDATKLLGTEFARRGMTEHLRRLRLYSLAVEAGLTEGPSHQVSVKMDRAELEREREELRLADVTAEARGLRKAMQKSPKGR